MQPKRIILLLFLCLVQLTSTAATARENKWQYCDTDNTTTNTEETTDYSNIPVDIDADKIDFISDGHATMTGNVIAKQKDRSISADRIDFKDDTKTLNAGPNVVFRSPSSTITSDNMVLETESDKGTFHNTQYLFHDSHARGSAALLQQENKDFTRLEKATYSTCDPDIKTGKRFWEFRADEFTMDKASGTGTGKHTRVYIKDVPIFYFPYIVFPIDDRRRSGFLYPGISTSNSRGFEVYAPWYWNIAENMDATLTPHVMSDRGLLMENEYRFLTKNSNGILHLNFNADDQVTGTSRHTLKYQQSTTFSPNTTATVLLNDVSDEDYFKDYADNLELISISHLERRADINHQFGHWNFLSRIQNYQTLDDSIAITGQHYQRLPQLVMSGSYGDLVPNHTFSLRSEWVNFYREASVTGTRFDVYPKATINLENSYGFLRPSVGLRYTTYNLDDQTPGLETTPSRTVPITSVDSGLVFERETGSNDHIVQTLEPRLFYVKVPNVNQDDIPIFDSGARTFTQSQLFRSDRFSGTDRVGDTNQLTFALKTRLINTESNLENLSASIGQIFYFEDRHVVLPGNPIETEKKSDIIIDLSSSLTQRLAASASLIWDPDSDETQQSSTQIRYRKDAKRLINFGYRYRENDLEQSDISFAWPIANRWRTAGRWNYSLKDDQSLETLLGLEYESCCWRFNIAARHHVLDTGETDNTLSLQLSLKGLSSIGSDIDQLLEDGILGYSR